MPLKGIYSRLMVGAASLWCLLVQTSVLSVELVSNVCKIRLNEPCFASDSWTVSSPLLDLGSPYWTTMLAVSRPRSLYHRLNNDMENRLALCSLTDQTRAATVDFIRWAQSCVTLYYIFYFTFHKYMCFWNNKCQRNYKNNKVKYSFIISSESVVKKNKGENAASVNP